MKGITILGSTGSIGVSTLDVIARHPERFRVVALTAHRNAERLAEQCRRFRPAYAVMVDPDAADTLATLLADMPEPPQVLRGAEALTEVAALDDVDYVMAAIVGAAGLMSSLAAARAGKRLMLANKEALVVAGALLMDAARENDATLLPIDSEHNAIFQCLPPAQGRGLPESGVERILLTASGGPFRDADPETLVAVTPEQAVAHPNWSMGRKISVDSATMMNKGLEIIEACWLFATSPERIQVVVHRQSVIHSMVQYADGSVLAQLGNPDMRTPIAHALGWPERIDAGVEPLDLFEIARLDFEPPAPERFPCLRLAYRAARDGGTAPVVLNAANEVAVAAFLERRIGFTDIARVVEQTMDRLPPERVDLSGLEHVLGVDAAARRAAEQRVAALVA
ncbi:1-deoxy-D-xylulose-5-phosphate reductoisomerase [Thiohalocapsa halophila]|uniref:1-deoxy-D-xylulose 5-phosphate reductoisomerase n=1 Tax=Thiohalocapsa halophila TaxID=69359 RepID=A0ABS1CFN1_9GAMM|nr:1-deoxy-D-xylulose-5-phosphate reductoisomerase [Thiohalocapsa halophila]MBK1630712.1 1-deoxy-D-xylulose-5-phosphate reductoisomerase [Thiohalocapsa halophila]